MKKNYQILNSIFVLCLFSQLSMAAAPDATDCDENYLKYYSLARSCVINKNQKSCEEFSGFSSLYPIAGGMAGGLAAQIMSKFADSKSDSLMTRDFLEKLKQFSKANDKAQEISKRLYEETARTFLKDPDFKYETFIANYNTYFDSTPERTKLRIPFLEEVDRQLSQEALKQKDPLLKAALDPETRDHVRLFLDDYFKVDINKLKSKNQDQLTAREQKILELNKMIWNWRITVARYKDSDKRSLREAIADQEAHHKARTRAAAKVGVAAGAAGGVVAAVAQDMAAPMANNVIESKKLRECQKDLSLSDAELSYLIGGKLESPKTQTLEGTSYFGCANIRIKDPDAVLSEVKLINGGKISPGVCKIIKNEVESIDKVFENLSSLREITCTGFKAANLEVSQGEKEKSFKLKLSDGFEVQAPIDEKKAWPELSQLRIYKNGKYSEQETLEFRQGYTGRTVSPTWWNPSALGEVQMTVSCLDVKNNSNMCKIARAASVAHLYYSHYKTSCGVSGNDQIHPQPNTQKSAY